jgi:hypothetical protein
MPTMFGERLKELGRVGDEIEEGGTLSVWLPTELVDSLTALASQVGVSRSALARELLTIAVPQAWDEVRGELEQFALDLGVREEERAIPLLRARRVQKRAARGTPAKRPRKAVKARKRAGRG